MQISDDRITTTISEKDEPHFDSKGGEEAAEMKPDNICANGRDDGHHQPSYVGISCLVSGYHRKVYTPLQEQTEKINSRAIEEGRKTPTRYRSPMHLSPFERTCNSPVCGTRCDIESSPLTDASSFIRSRVEQFQVIVQPRQHSVVHSTNGDDTHQPTVPLKPRRLVSPTKVVIEVDDKQTHPIVTGISAAPTSPVSPTSPDRAKQSPSFNKLAQFIEQQDAAVGKIAVKNVEPLKPTPPQKPPHLRSPLSPGPSTTSISAVKVVKVKVDKVDSSSREKATPSNHTDKNGM